MKFTLEPPRTVNGIYQHEMQKLKNTMTRASLFTFIFLPLFSFECYTQDIKYARYILDTLCAPQMYGRGYVNAGESIAADFIAHEFSLLGLEKLSEHYLQKFEVPVNTLPGALSVKLGNEGLLPGVDYLVDPGSPTIKGTFDIVHLTEAQLLEEALLIETLRASANKFLAISPSTIDLTKDQKKQVQEIINFLKYNKNNPAAGTILFVDNKLTWYGATKQLSKPTLIVKNESSFKSDSIYLEVQSKYFENYPTQNVIGYLRGKAFPDSLIVFTAHYDHLGQMGDKTYFPGANDNASGVAMLLNLAQHYAQQKDRLKHSILFIAFGAEEIGLLGSKFYTEFPLLPLAQIKFLINFDISGTGDEGIQVVNGAVYQDKFDTMATINHKNGYLKEVKIRGAACNSDHCMFDKKNVPNFYIYTLGGIKAYHDIFDKAETLPFTEFEDYFKLLVDFIEEIQ